MAKLYLLRSGTGNARIASSFSVSIERLKECYGKTSVIFSKKMPTINGKVPANSVSNPEVAVVELLEGDESFGSFISPGFNILSNVNAKDAYECLINVEARSENNRR